MRKIKKTFCLLVLILLMVVFFGCQKQGNNNLTQITVGLLNFYVDTALTGEDRAIGLMHRPYLPKRHGMLIVFEDEKIKNSIWMKNMYFPIDIVWISEDKQVVDFKTIPPCKNVQCPSYRSSVPAKYVLEINANEFKGKKGDYVDFVLPGVKRRKR